MRTLTPFSVALDGYGVKTEVPGRRPSGVSQSVARTGNEPPAFASQLTIRVPVTQSINQTSRCARPCTSRRTLAASGRSAHMGLPKHASARLRHRSQCYVYGRSPDVRSVTLGGPSSPRRSAASVPVTNKPRSCGSSWDNEWVLKLIGVPRLRLKPDVNCSVFMTTKRRLYRSRYAQFSCKFAVKKKHLGLKRNETLKQKKVDSACLKRILLTKKKACQIST